jgi:hypothetical protein
MFSIISRTAEQKADLAGTWEQPDEDFFAAGACHILAGAFLEAYPSAGFHALMLQPANGFRGGHVVVTNQADVFDCRGWSAREAFLRCYSEGCQKVYPGWSCSLVVIDQPLSWSFARDHCCRHASQFYRDPLPRAHAYLARFPAPRAT